MIKKLLKQVVGIDVSHKKLDVSLGRMDEQTITRVYMHKTFDNSEKGFMVLILWIKKHTEPDVPPRFVMEATGVYHQSLAYYLSGKGYAVSIVMPNKISNFFKTLEGKTVTDKSMSAAIAMFGLEKNPDNWAPPKKAYRELRQVTRERDQIKAERTMVKNQLHAEEVEAFPCAKAIVRIKVRINMLDSQVKEIIAEVKAIVKNEAEVADAMALITTIPGVGVLTGAIILAETDGFALIKNKRQLTSYSGLDVKLKDSGTSVHGKPRISKKGNKHLRKAMHMPALAAIGCNTQYKAIFDRIFSKTGIKMKGVVAVQRKLLEMAYTIYKTKKPFELNYMENQAKKKLELKPEMELEEVY
jgi:transposase